MKQFHSITLGLERTSEGGDDSLANAGSRECNVVDGGKWGVGGQG